MKIYIFVLFFACLSVQLMSQKVTTLTNSIKPSWTLNDIPQSGDFEYYVGIGTSRDLSAARQMANSEVFRSIAAKKGIDFETNSVTKNSEIESQKGKSNELQKTFQFEGVVKVTGKKITISGLTEVDSYYEFIDNQYVYYLLMRLPISDDKTTNSVPLFSYNKGHIWRSVAVAGWGQLYLKQSKKGSIFLAGEVATLSGTFVMHILANNYDSKYTTYLRQSSTTNAKLYKKYRDNALLTRNISAIALGCIYTVNLVDAFSTKGSKSFAHKKELFIYPTYAENSSSLNLKLKF